MAGERAAKSKSWPENPRALGGRLRRGAPFLRKIGIEISFGREGRARTRTIQIEANPGVLAQDNAGIRASAPSAASARSGTAVELDPLVRRTVANDTDGADANRPTRSATETDDPPAWRARL